jgi:putative addiction module CopG family antidote
MDRREVFALMTLQLPLDIQQVVDDQLASGEFANAHDVLREALRLLVERQTMAQDLAANLAEVEPARKMALEDLAAEIRRRRS